MSTLQQLRGQIAMALRLNLRNPMAMIYGFAFPMIFLLAFWAIYRNDRVPLLLHMGELLTVTVLGGACFGLPTAMVSERERGVWRRYRLSPAHPWMFVASVLVSRYVLLLTAALLQLCLAMLLGMPAPRHPVSLLIAFTVVSASFLGLGMDIAMLADSVPAVQAIGQCVFLPMLMIGGVAVRLSSLPPWAQHVSAFFPGRYAVNLLQRSVSGLDLHGTAFDVFALLLIALAGSTAAVQTFRWDPKERYVSGRSKVWLLLALGTWVLVGLLAEHTGRIHTLPERPDDIQPATFYQKGIAAPGQPPVAKAGIASTQNAGETAAAPPVINNPRSPAMADHTPVSWQEVTPGDIANLAFDRLPPDQGIVSPVAHAGETSDPAVEEQLEQIRSTLSTWQPGTVADPVQRARNDLYIAAIPDVLQMEQVERFVPLLVFSRLRRDIPEADLPKVLYWIATHPDQGDATALERAPQFGLPLLNGQTRAARGRVMIYALKLLGRLTGDIQPL